MCGPYDLPDEVDTYPVEADPTYVGPGAAAMLAIMKQFDVQLDSAECGGVHTLWEDPREDQIERPVPTCYDKALQVATVLSRTVRPRVPCKPEKEVVARMANCCSALAPSCASRETCGRAFRRSAWRMGPEPADADDAATHQDRTEVWEGARWHALVSA